MNPQVVRLLIRDRRNKGWFRVSNDIWLMEISKFAKLIYCYLARCAEDASTCNPSFPDIRRKTGCSHGTIVKALQELKTAKLIKPKPQVGTSTEYEIFDPIVERTQSTGDRPLPSHGLTAPQSPADQTTQSPVDRKEDLVLNKTEVNKTLPPPPDGSGEPPKAQELLLVEAEAVEEPHGLARPAVGPTHAAAGNGHDPATAAPARRGHPGIALFFDRWKAHHGKVPTINSKRIGILTRIYDGLGPEAPEEYPRLLDAFFRSTDRFIVDNAHSPEVLQVRLDSLRVNGNGKATGRESMSISQKWAGAKPGLVEL
jgi:Helix-turn-helix domain